MTIKGNSQTGGTVRSTTGDTEILNGLTTFNKAGVQTFNATTPTNVSYQFCNSQWNYTEVEFRTITVR